MNFLIILQWGVFLKNKKCVAMLLAGGQGSRLGVLTSKIAKPAVPFGGKYRIIDFPLSNCINSGIDTVGLLQAVDTVIEMVANGDNGIPVPDYTDENVSDKVVKIIQSFTGVVNTMVWRK